MYLTQGRIWNLIPSWPLVIWMIAAALALALAGGLGAPEMIRVFNAGWGRALGEFALILLPSFTLAAALARHCRCSRTAPWPACAAACRNLPP
ncbi:MAG TPA: hypothetical protein QF861_04455, partial [Alphaproteobacteria bacterium]|nr:hypothetical protein [Alphaproteobacteria bacterium]